MGAQHKSALMLKKAALFLSLYQDDLVEVLCGVLATPNSVQGETCSYK